MSWTDDEDTAREEESQNLKELRRQQLMRNYQTIRQRVKERQESDAASDDDELSDQEQARYNEILDAHHRRGHKPRCIDCGEPFRMDNIYICTSCGTDYCFRCVWRLRNVGEEGNPRFRCGCGGKVL